MLLLGLFLVYLLSADVANDPSLGMDGAILQMISHAFSSGAMFIGIGILYERMHTRAIKDFGGIVNSMPVFAAFYMLFAMANAGLPGTSGFVGEFMVILTAFKASFWIAFAAAMTLILAAAYTLWMYKRVFFGRVANSTVAALEDVNAGEVIVLLLLAVPILVIGVYPQILIEIFHTSASHLLAIAQHTKL